MINTEKLLRALDHNYFMTEREQKESALLVRSIQLDAERYRWLSKYTAQLFMVTPEEMNAQVDRAMGKG